MGKIPRKIFKWNTASLFVYYFIINDSSPMILFALRYVIEDPEDLWFCIYRPITDIYMIFKIVFCQHWATTLFFFDCMERIGRIFKKVTRLQLKFYCQKVKKKNYFLFFWKFWKNDHFFVKNSKQHYTVTVIKSLWNES